MEIQPEDLKEQALGATIWGGVYEPHLIQQAAFHINELANMRINHPNIINKEGFNNKVQELCNRIKL